MKAMNGVFFHRNSNEKIGPLLLPGASDEDEEVVCSVCRMPQVVGFCGAIPWCFSPTLRSAFR